MQNSRWQEVSGAAVVLVSTGRRFLSAALVQGLPPLAALVLIVS